jgi:hypothetical protein
LNRIDAGYGDTITDVVNSAQFRGYRPDNPMFTGHADRNAFRNAFRGGETYES